MIRKGPAIALVLIFALVLPSGCGRDVEDLPRVLVVVVSGADLEFIEPMIQAGKLPAMARLFREGVHGALFSTIPPVMPPIWGAISTGKDPGQTGLYQWTILAPETYRGAPVTGASFALEKRVWDLVGEAGGRVILLNLPLTFPPSKTPGVLVCGVPADEDGIYTYPPGLSEQLRQTGYVPFFKSRRTVDEYVSAMNQRAEMAAKYMRRLEWNLCMVCFKNLDELCRSYIDDPEAVEAAYVEADRCLGRLIETAGPETSVMLISGQGFLPRAYDRYFSINRWLLEEGFLGLRGWIDDSLRVVPFTEEQDLEDLGLGKYQILWPGTRAFSIADCHSNFGHIQINVRGREPSGVVETGTDYQGLVQDIKRRLLNYRDPQTGENIVTRVYTREEISRGERVDMLPDIFFQTARGVLPLGVSFAGYFELSQVVGPLEIGRNHPYPGNNEREGVFALAGPQVRVGERVDSELINAAPTILYMLGLPVPADFSGRVIEEAFVPEQLSATPVKIDKDDARRKDEPEFIVSPHPPDAEEKNILDSLGYLQQ